MKRKTSIFAVCIGVSIIISVHPVLSETNRPYIGINLCPLNDWDPVKLFADAVKNAREFTGYSPSDEWNNDLPVNKDVDGWPLGDAKIVMFDGTNMSGVYHLYLTTQKSSVDARTVKVQYNWADAAVLDTAYTAATNTVAYGVRVNGNKLCLWFMNTGGGVKNVKFMRPIASTGSVSYDTAVVFTTPAKDILKKFRVLRFMQVVNALWDNMVVNWADRTKPTYCCQQARTFGGKGPAGVAWEYLIQLCNVVGTDMYVNIPFLSSDDYIRQLATLLKNTLKPELKIYTEYANEVWNFGTGYDGSRNHDSAVAEVNRGGSTLNFDGETNEWYWGWRRTARRDKEISEIFRSVFGDSAMMTRVRPLLMNQLADGQATLGQGLLLMEDYYNNPAHVSNPRPPSYYFYGAGGAPYYSPASGANITMVWNSGDFNVDSFAVSQLLGDISMCATFGLKRVAYEGGPGLNNDSLSAQVWRDNRIIKAMIDHHNTWSNYGGDVFVYFTLANWGSTDNQWSFIHTLEEPATPKMRAVDSLNGMERAPVTYGKTVPAVFNDNAWLRSPDWRSYIIRVEKAGTYGVTAKVSHSDKSIGVRILWDGVRLGSTTLPGEGVTPKYTMFLEPGLHGVMVHGVDNPFMLDQVNVTVEGYSKNSVTGNTNRAVVHKVMKSDVVHDVLRLKVSADHAGVQTISLCTLQGRTVVQKYINLSESANEMLLPVGNIGKGCFILRTAQGKMETGASVILVK